MCVNKWRHINVYDSLYSTTPSALVQQLCCFLKTQEKQVTINLMEMQSQSGGSDCGCFAVASAAALCQGEDPSCFVWSQEKMRGYLLDCLTERKMHPFSAKKKMKSSTLSTWVKKTVTIPVFCSCRGPANRKGMLQCVKCSEWFHKTCCNIPASSFRKNVVWKCPTC